MMNLWEKNKKELLLFSTGKKKNIMMLFCESLALSIASYFFIPFFIADVISQDFYFLPWYLVGIGALCFGGIGMIYSLFSFGEKRSLKEKLNILWKTLGIYIGLRVVLSLVFGGLGTILVQNVNDLNMLKNLIDKGLQLTLGPLNGFLLLYFIKHLNSSPWKLVWDNMMLVTVLFYSMDLLLFMLQRMGESYGALTVRAILSAGMMTLIVSYTFYVSNKNTCDLELT